jgi:hypothetical protein
LGIEFDVDSWWCFGNEWLWFDDFSVMVGFEVLSGLVVFRLDLCWRVDANWEWRWVFRVFEAWISSLGCGKMWFLEVILEGPDWDFVVDFLFNDIGVGFGFN